MSQVEALQESVEIAATPERVWSLITDLPRMASWSPQVVKTFVRGGTVRLGTRAVNVNRRGPLVWPTRSKVVAFEPHHEFGFQILDNAAIWSFVLEPTADGTRLVQERRTPDGVTPVSRQLQKTVLGGVDRFTGELRVPRVDLLIDIGRSINPGVDRGQVVGGFIQGMGWVTAEALVYDDRGDLLSHSPTTYKIPAITDVPEVFNVATFDNYDNVRNVYRSKAVGEPPLMLAIAVWAAVKNALSHAGPGVEAELRLPATGEEILRCLTKASSLRSEPLASAAMPNS